MIRLHDKGALVEFADRAGLIAHFSLTCLPDADLAGIRAAGDAGFPLHAAIDPCIEEIRDMRVLLLETDARTLAREVRQRIQDI